MGKSLMSNLIEYARDYFREVLAKDQAARDWLMTRFKSLGVEKLVDLPPETAMGLVKMHKALVMEANMTPTERVWKEISENTGMSLLPELLSSRKFVAAFLTGLADQVHADNMKTGWWTDLDTGEDLHGKDERGRHKRNRPEMLMLVVSEVSEAMEGHRKGLADDKLPDRPMFRVELLDAIIRLLDILGSEDNDIHPAGDIFMEKREYNAQRADHKPENRKASGGKAF